MNWLLNQLATPSTHNAIAAVFAAATPYIPQPWGMIATAFFAALGIVVPEPGENPHV